MKKSIKKVLIILVLVLAAFFVLPSVFMNAYLAKLTDIPKETKTVTAAEHQPEYLRMSQAERERAEAERAGNKHAQEQH